MYVVVGVGGVENRAFGSQRLFPYDAMVVGTSKTGSVSVVSKRPELPARSSRTTATWLSRFWMVACGVDGSKRE